MMLKPLLVTALLLASVSTSALAQNAQRSGTPEEQKACAKDVSRHCREIMNEGDFIILACLQKARAQGQLSVPCQKVLTSHGQ
jgi:hypothetical protein